MGVYYLPCLCTVSSSDTGLCLSDCLKRHHSLKTGILVFVVAMSHFVSNCTVVGAFAVLNVGVSDLAYISNTATIQEWLFVSCLV